MKCAVYGKLIDCVKSQYQKKDEDGERTGNTVEYLVVTILDPETKSEYNRTHSFRLFRSSQSLEDVQKLLGSQIKVMGDYTLYQGQIRFDAKMVVANRE
jgi:hypothetical protein